MVMITGSPVWSAEREIIADYMIKWLVYGGGDEIRTHETCYSLLAFQASAFNRSATPP